VIALLGMALEGHKIKPFVPPARHSSKSDGWEWFSKSVRTKKIVSREIRDINSGVVHPPPDGGGRLFFYACIALMIRKITKKSGTKILYATKRTIKFNVSFFFILPSLKNNVIPPAAAEGRAGNNVI